MNTEAQAMQTGMRLAQASSKLMSDILAALLEYLEQETKNAGRKELAAWIRKGGGVYAYDPKENADLLKSSLTEQGVPYVQTSTGHLIVRLSDAEKVHESNIQINIAKGNYYQEVDGKKLENALAKSNYKDKQVLSVDGLDKYEIEVIKNKCNNINRGFMVGIERDKNGTHKLSVVGRNVYNTDPKKNDFCKAYLNSLFSLYGPNKEIKKKQIEADEAIDKEILSYKDRDDTAYVVGSHNSYGYIELSKDGFQFYEPHKSGNGVLDVAVATIQKNDPSYDVELQRYMDKLKDRVILTKKDELDAFNAGKLNIASKRPIKNKEEYTRSKAENATVAKINELIKQFEARNVLDIGKATEADDKFSFYVQQAKIIINAIAAGTIPKGYTKDEIEEATKDLRENGFSLSDYKDVTKRLEEIQYESHKAREMNILERRNKEINPDKNLENRHQKGEAR